MALHGSQHLRALYTVFIRPALHAHLELVARRPPTPLRLFSTTSHRPFSTTHSRLLTHRKSSNTARPAKATKTQSFRDNDILARRLRIVDEQGQLGEVQTKFSAMRDIDTATHRLVCVSKPPRHLSPSDPQYEEIAANYDYVVEQYLKQRQRFGKSEEPPEEEQDESSELELGSVHRAPAILVMPARYIRLPTGEEWVPVCKIENKAEATMRARELAAAQKEQKKIAPAGVKVIELNWAIDGNDLGHRLKKLEEFLQGRRRVEIIIAPKKRGRKATKEECDALLKKVKDAVEKIQGAKELRPMEGKLGEVASLMLEGNREK